MLGSQIKWYPFFVGKSRMTHHPRTSHCKICWWHPWDLFRYFLICFESKTIIANLLIFPSANSESFHQTVYSMSTLGPAGCCQRPADRIEAEESQSKGQVQGKAFDAKECLSFLFLRPCDFDKVPLGWVYASSEVCFQTKNSKHQSIPDCCFARGTCDARGLWANCKLVFRVHSSAVIAAAL